MKSKCLIFEAWEGNRTSESKNFYEYGFWHGEKIPECTSSAQQTQHADFQRGSLNNKFLLSSCWLEPCERGQRVPRFSSPKREEAKPE